MTIGASFSPIVNPSRGPTSLRAPGPRCRAGPPEPDPERGGPSEATPPPCACAVSDVLTPPPVGAPDAGPVVAAPGDAGAVVAAPGDAGPIIGGPLAAAPGDAGPAVVVDAGPVDAGGVDGSPTDGGTPTAPRSE